MHKKFAVLFCALAVMGITCGLLFGVRVTPSGLPEHLVEIASADVGWIELDGHFKAACVTDREQIARIINNLYETKFGDRVKRVSSEEDYIIGGTIRVSIFKRNGELYNEMSFFYSGDLIWEDTGGVAYYETYDPPVDIAYWDSLLDTE